MVLVLIFLMLMGFFSFNLKSIYHKLYLKEVVKKPFLSNLNEDQSEELYNELLLSIPYFKREKQFEKSKSDRNLGVKVMIFTVMYALSILSLILFVIVYMG